MLATNSKAMWYLTRGTGMVSLVLLTLTVALGIAEVARYASPRLPRFVLAALHKNVSLLAVAFLAVHILTAVADSFAPINLLDAFIPFVGTYRPIWLGLGTRCLRPPHRARSSRACCASESVTARGASCTGPRTPAGRSR